MSLFIYSTKTVREGGDILDLHTSYQCLGTLVLALYSYLVQVQVCVFLDLVCNAWDVVYGMRHVVQR